MRSIAILSVTLLALGLVACGGERERGSNGSVDAIVGTWRLDVEASVPRMKDFMRGKLASRGGEMTEAELDAGVRADLQSALVELEVRADGTWTSTRGEDERRRSDEGTWTARERAYGFRTVEQGPASSHGGTRGEVRMTLDGDVLLMQPYGEAEPDFVLVLRRR